MRPTDLSYFIYKSQSLAHNLYEWRPFMKWNVKMKCKWMISFMWNKMLIMIWSEENERFKMNQSTEYNSITKLPNSQSPHQGQMMVWLTAMQRQLFSTWFHLLVLGSKNSCELLFSSKQNKNFWYSQDFLPEELDHKSNEIRLIWKKKKWQGCDVTCSFFLCAIRKTVQSRLMFKIYFPELLNTFHPTSSPKI